MAMHLSEAYERALIILIALHSIIVGVMLLFFAEWAIEFAGWSGAEPIFFIWQAGAFHFVLAAGYLVEYSRTKTISLLLIAKTTAFVFLIGGSLIADTPWSVWFSGVADGTMALTAFLVHRAVNRDVTD
jgi:hypothetical protein